MSWLFSQALAVEFLGDCSLDGQPFAPLNVMPTQHKFWRNDKTMDTLSLSRFGLTLQVLTESRGEELLMWFRAGFPVRTYQSPVKVQESQAQGQDFGKSSPGLLARYDPATHSLKTVQLSLLADLEPSSVTLPRWGSMRNGELYLRKTWEPITDESASGLWPTPVKSDTSSRSTKYKQGGTPLSMAVKVWPTPTRHNAKECNAPAEATRNTPTLAHEAGGKLNPDWTEWLMGWPIKWSDLGPSATGKCLCALQQHGKC